jgi:hypothetical protein
MLRLPVYLIICLMLCQLSDAQVRNSKPVKTRAKTTNFGLGAGVTRSVLYLSRNIQENNDATGLNFTAVYSISKLYRANLEYTLYSKIDIAPTWYRIRARTIETNFHILARFQDSKSYLYPIVGLSYNLFTGYFTGINDFQNLSSIYKQNEDIRMSWLGLNTGLGFEFFIQRMSVFMEYKMRIGFTEVQHELNIMDVCLSAGLKMNLKVPTIYSLFKGTRSRYLLNSQESN